MKKYIKKSLPFFLSLMATTAFAQKNFNNFSEFYPIGEDPNVRWMSSYTQQERILFEANPNVRYSIFNNFVKGLMNNQKHTQSWHLSFKPQLRMYNDYSSPVRTPSYRIFLGTQHMFRLKNTS